MGQEREGEGQGMAGFQKIPQVLEAQQLWDSPPLALEGEFCSVVTLRKLFFPLGSMLGVF